MDWARRIELVTVVVAAAVAVVGLWYSNVQTRQANEQARNASTQARDDRALAKEGQITDRYTAAVGNLGEDKMDVRLGGIYALQRIMQDSRRDHPTISNVLATYIRTHAAKPPAKGQDIPAHVHAALTVLAARDTNHDGEFVLDLHGAKLPNVTLALPAALQNANLSGANLNDANLNGTDLKGANLHNADLSTVDLSDANLSRTDLIDADLSHADLRATKLNDANLRGANLRGASLNHADLRGANLSSTDLSDADLSRTDLRGAKVESAQLDFSLTNSSTRT